MTADQDLVRAARALIRAWDDAPPHTPIFGDGSAANDLRAALARVEADEPEASADSLLAEARDRIERLHEMSPVWCPVCVADGRMHEGKRVIEHRPGCLLSRIATRLINRIPA